MTTPDRTETDRPWKTGWDLVILATTLTAVLALPYQMVAGSIRARLLYHAISAIFLLDLLIPFMLSVRGDGRTGSRISALARVPRNNWFLPDLIAALPLASILPALGFRMQEHPVIMTFLFALPLTKLAKALFLASRLRDRISAPPALTRLGVFAFWFISLAHFMSLGWIAIGAGETGRPFPESYLRALYWCITTITTIGYGDYGPDPDSNLQILYTLAVQLIGVGMFSYVIGNVATLVVNLDASRSEFRRKVEQARDYMRVRKIPEPLRERVLDYYRFRWESRERMPETGALEDLPPTLRTDIALFENRTMLQSVDLFRRLDERLLRALIARLDPMIFLPGDTIIEEGEFGACMYFLTRGRVAVIKEGRTVTELPPGSPFGETALMQGERRNASIRARTYCEGYRLSKCDFDRLREEYPEFDRQIREVMHTRLTATPPPASPPEHETGEFPFPSADG